MKRGIVWNPGTKTPVRPDSESSACSDNELPASEPSSKPKPTDLQIVSLLLLLALKLLLFLARHALAPAILLLPISDWFLFLHMLMCTV